MTKIRTDCITFSTLFGGFGPLTSNPFMLNGVWGMNKNMLNRAVVVSLTPYYKKGTPSLWANFYPASLDKATRKDEIFGGTAFSATKIKLYPAVNPKSALHCSAAQRGQLLDSECETLINAILDARVYGANDDRAIHELPFESLLQFAQPARDRRWLDTLPSNIYKALAMRFTGFPASHDEIKTKQSCIDAICYGTASAETAHPDFLEDYERGTPLARQVAQYNLNHPSMQSAPTTGIPIPAPAPASAPTAASNPPALATVGLPPMPSAGDGLMDQIEKLTKRADAAGELAVKVEELAAEIHDLKNRPQVVIQSGPQFTSNGNVKLGKDEVPHFGLTAMGKWSVPEIKPGYSVDGWTAKFQCGDLDETFSLADVFKSALRGNTPTRIVGGPATGKTSGIVQACAHAGVPCHIIQCGKGMTEYTLLGEQTIENGSVVWKDGILPALFREVNPDGPHVVMLDEGDHLTAAIQSLLHGVLEGRVLDLPNGEKITIPDNVIVMMTSNTYGTGDITGRHASANVSDDAFISRWVRTYTAQYLPEHEEKELLLAYGMPPKRVNALMKFVTGTRDQARKIDSGELGDGIRTPVTLRTLIPLAQDCADGGDFRKSFLSTVMGQFSPDEMAKARELVRSCLDF